MVKMVKHEAFACKCAKGDVVLRQLYQPECCGKLFYACPKSKPLKNFRCGFFLWKETRLRELMSSPKAPSYSAGPSTPLRSSRNAECSNCKHLRRKISVLKETMDMHMHPEHHTVNSAALIHEVLNEMEKLDLEYLEYTWLTDSPLIQFYPRLFALECNKHATVVEKLSDISLIFSFRRTPHGGAEEEKLVNLLDNVDSVILSNSNDGWVWSLESSGEFSVKSARVYIDDCFLLSVGSTTRWVKVVPIKINILAWKVCLDKLPARLNLSLRGIDIPSITCPICSSADWLAWLISIRLQKGFKDVLQGIFYVMWWVIWNFRSVWKLSTA
ncbi:hypothetical protein Tco_0950596 [Tanacetum coccineum]